MAARAPARYPEIGARPGAGVAGSVTVR
jgi:hypothetical protein